MREMRVGEMIELHTEDGARIAAYRAAPPAAPKGGIVVVQEAFGVNHHIRSVADRFAAEGYLALAPALYDRAEKGVELGYGDEDLKRGMALAKAIPMDQHVASIDAAIAAVAQAGPVAIVGFCLGGLVAYAAAAHSGGLAAAVAYYGGMIPDMADVAPKCPAILHFGEKDQHIPMAAVDKIKAAHPSLPVYTYPAGHGFNCDERPSYDRPSADLAWTRTLALIEREMRHAA